VAKLWNQFNVNTSQEWIGRRLGEEKRNLHRIIMPCNLGWQVIKVICSKKTFNNIINYSTLLTLLISSADSKAFTSAGSITVTCIMNNMIKIIAEWHQNIPKKQYQAKRVINQILKKIRCKIWHGSTKTWRSGSMYY